MANPREILSKYFQYPKFRGEQEAIINRTLRKESSLVLMPTGMGKSLCYQIPAKILSGTVLVISPLIALMKDQVDAAKKRGFQCDFINSSISGVQRSERYQKLANGEYELVYVTPERFQKEEFRESINKASISLLAIDEAHCISQWGHDFRPDFTRIAEFRKLLNQPTTIALTATATREVRDDIIKQLGMSESNVKIFSHGIERENLTLSCETVHSLESKVERFLIFRKQHPQTGIIYFALISSLENFSEQLNKAGVSHLIYHGQLSDRDRKRQQNLFMQDDKAVILATPAFGLGVDKANIRFVMHAEIPGSLEAYYQEVGRAGRDGKSANALLLYDEDDLTIQMDFIKWANPDPDFIRTVFKLIQNNEARVNAEGVDFLRSQMHFYHKRDFRVETSLNLLERWGCLKGEIRNHNLKALDPPPKEFLDPTATEARRVTQQKKLLEMVQFAKMDTGYKERLKEYFAL